MAEKQRQLARVIVQDPDVVSLSSFIGVDGTNMTPNAGASRMQLKPRDQRSSDVTQIIRRLSDKVQSVEGIQLYMQAVQDLTVEQCVSRTQYQYSLEAADANELATWVPMLVQKLQALPNLRDVATDQQNHALRRRFGHDHDSSFAAGHLQRRSITPCTTLLGSAWCRSCSPRSISTTWWRPNCGTTPERAEQPLC